VTLSLDRDLDVEPGATHLRQEPVEHVQTRLRSQRRRLAVAAQHPEQPPHLGQGLPRRGLDSGEVLGLAGMLGTEPAAYRLGLDRDHADRVRHDVVQLAGDPAALLRGHRGRLRLALSLEAVGPCHRLLCA
jgi:hypothetical protein